MPLFVGRVEDTVFGGELRERREEVGLSQAELGLIAGVHRGTIRNAEAGRPLEARTATNVLRALGCTWLRGSADDDPAVDPGVMDVLSVRLTRNITRAILDLPDDDHESFEKVVADYFEVVAEAAQASEAMRRAVRLRDNADAKLTILRSEQAARIKKSGAEDPEITALIVEMTRQVDEATHVLHSLRQKGIPASVERLRVALVDKWPMHQIRDYAAEMGRFFGEKYPLDVTAPTITPGLGRGIGALIPKTPVLSDMQLIVESGLPDDVKQQLMDHMSTRRAETEGMLRRELTMLIEQLSRISRSEGRQ